MNISYQGEKDILDKFDRYIFEDQVDQYKNISEEIKSQFIQEEIINGLKNKTEFREFIGPFYEFYQLNSLTFSNEVRDAYDDLLNDSYAYKWNIPISDIASKIEDINNSGIIYIPINMGTLLSMHTINVNIGTYFKEEFISIIANSGRFVDSNPESLQKLIDGFDFDHNFENYLRRREYSKNNSLQDNQEKSQSDLDEKLNPLFDLVDYELENGKTEVAGKKIKKIIRKIAKGRVEDEYLKMLFEKTLLAPGYEQGEKYSAFYPLLLFLLKDKIGLKFDLYTASEFEQQVDRPERKKTFYKGNYKKYQKSRVVRILGL
ncbi:hypothetical protein [Lacibacter sediminis]|uniref:Uncharacterized protein n=1 Tax=Lacibacter sediminis TaxID=2760713 RepID=A0A7G5XLV4_9BACT|nr:hypothetical protein [Lacibacter sediminis]QNA46457.1 hypothetical protein H4075_09880 [Lacibacter sediminis]